MCFLSLEELDDLEVLHVMDSEDIRKEMEEMDNMTCLERIKYALEGLPEDKRAIGEALYNKLEFLDDTLAKLQADVEQGGVIELFRQGRSQYNRERPALKSYNTTLQRYIAVVKQIIDLLPKQDAADLKDELMDFVTL